MAAKGRRKTRFSGKKTPERTATMPAYLAYFTRDYDIPPIPATLKATYDDDAVLHDPGDTFADIEPGAEVLFYQPRVGVVGAGIRAKNAVRGWAAFDSYTREPDEGVMYTIQELKDAGVDALPSSRDPNIKIGALIRSTLKGLRRASKADVAAEGVEIERQRALMEVALRPDQPAFAAQVRKNWRDRCPLSGFSGLFCDAAHLVNFASCDPKGAADPDNGILLAAHLHKAFDRHLFGITPDGEIVWSKQLPAEDRKEIKRANTATQIDVTRQMRPYLERRFALFEQAERGLIGEDAA
jgi:hypothetical protein